MDPHSTTGEQNLRWCTLLVASLVEQGIDHFVISPGSRSTPLALAVARNPNAHYRVIIDERSAAYFALGQARQRRRASALICTSGTAVANWLPAVVEANHAAIPLLLLSADRPAELHHRGANQTIEQQQLFSTHTRTTHPLSPPDEQEAPEQTIATLLQTVVTQLQQPIPGPVHINIPLREPLLPQSLQGIDWCPATSPLLPPRTLSRSWLRLHEVTSKIGQQPGVILCGEGEYQDDFAEQLFILSERLDTVILADPLSNLRWGNRPYPRLLTHYDATLRSALAQQKPHWVIQFGDFPLSKTVANWLRQSSPQHFFNIQHRRLWSDPEALTTETFHCSPQQFVQALLKQIEHPVQLPHWSPPFLSREQQAARWCSKTAASEPALLQQLRQQIPAGGVLFSGNSMVIRDIDGWLGSREAPLTLHANRGASGIDGNLSTACGIRSVLEPEHPMVAMLGDVTLFHDLNALSLLQQTGGNLTLIVINNGGGNIFNYLPPATLPELETLLEPLWLTPPALDFEQAATLYRIPYQRIDAESVQPLDLEQLLSRALRQSGPNLVEWVVSGSHSVATHQHYWESLQ